MKRDKAIVEVKNHAMNDSRSYSEVNINIFIFTNKDKIKPDFLEKMVKNAKKIIITE